MRARQRRFYPSACACASRNIPGIFFQTSSHSTLLVRWSCPVQFITRVNVTFILAMTIMFFSTCHSQVGIIPCVICFVLHVLQSSGTHRCLKATETGDCFIKYARFLHWKQERGYLTWRVGYIPSVRNGIRHNNYTEITILNRSLIITLLCATRKQRRPKDLKRLKA